MPTDQVTARTRQLDPAFGSTGAVLAMVQADQLDAPTPCALSRKRPSPTNPQLR